MEILALPQVRKLLLRLDPRIRGDAARLFNRLEKFGHQLDLPDSKPLGNGLFELRGTGQSIIRIFYAFVDGKAILLHVYIKKSQKIPLNDLRLARKRLRDLT